MPRKALNLNFYIKVEFILPYKVLNCKRFKRFTPFFSRKKGCRARIYTRGRDFFILMSSINIFAVANASSIAL